MVSLPQYKGIIWHPANIRTPGLDDDLIPQQTLLRVSVERQLLALESFSFFFAALCEIFAVFAVYALFHCGL
jgi:hypothetical protein